MKNTILGFTIFILIGFSFIGAGAYLLYTGLQDLLNQQQTSSIRIEYNSTQVDVSPYEQAVLSAQDSFRESRGMNTLLLNKKLSQAALRKAESICETGVWAHEPVKGLVIYKQNSPVGTVRAYAQYEVTLWLLRVVNYVTVLWCYIVFCITVRAVIS